VNELVLHCWLLQFSFIFSEHRVHVNIIIYVKGISVDVLDRIVLQLLFDADPSQVCRLFHCFTFI